MDLVSIPLGTINTTSVGSFDESSDVSIPLGTINTAIDSQNFWVQTGFNSTRYN